MMTTRGLRMWGGAAERMANRVDGSMEMCGRDVQIPSVFWICRCAKRFWIQRFNDAKRRSRRRAFNKYKHSLAQPWSGQPSSHQLQQPSSHQLVPRPCERARVRNLSVSRVRLVSSTC
jgi:hypothetical protein